MNELLLTGNVSEEEAIELQSRLADLRVVKYQTKGLTTSDVVQLVFHNLDLLTFSRDFLLANSLNYIIGQIRMAVDYFKTRNKKVGPVNIEMQIKDRSKEFLLYVSSDSDRIGTAISMIDDQIEVIVDRAKHGNTIQVKLGKNSAKIEINEI